MQRRLEREAFCGRLEESMDPCCKDKKKEVVSSQTNALCGKLDRRNSVAFASARKPETRRNSLPPILTSRFPKISSVKCAPVAKTGGRNDASFFQEPFATNETKREYTFSCHLGTTKKPLLSKTGRFPVDNSSFRSKETAREHQDSKECSFQRRPEPNFNGSSRWRTKLHSRCLNLDNDDY